LQSSDGQDITAHVTTPGNEATYAPGLFVEIIGKVRDAKNLEEYNSVTLSANFAMDVYDQYVQLAHMFPDLFGTASAQ